MTTKIREATVEDIPRIIEIEKSCFNECDRFKESQFKYLITKGQGSFFVFPIKNIHAYFYVYPIGKRGVKLHSFAVERKYQQRGTGQRLLILLNKIMQNNAAFITLEVRCDNKRAINLYKKYGYKYCRIKHNYYKDGMDAIEMIKELQCQRMTG